METLDRQLPLVRLFRRTLSLFPRKFYSNVLATGVGCHAQTANRPWRHCVLVGYHKFTTKKHFLLPFKDTKTFV